MPFAMGAEMTAILSAWMAEVLLEAWGAFLYRRRSPLLSVILSFTALTDIAAFYFKGILPPAWIYFWAAWGQFYVKEFMLIWLGCSICGMFAKGRNRTQAVISCGVVSLGTVAIVMAFCFPEQTLKDRLLAAECIADMLLLVIVFLAWIWRGIRLSGEWKWIAAGYLIMVGTDVFFTIGWYSNETLRHWYPVGQIAAYAVWVAGPLRSALEDSRRYMARLFAGRHLKHATATIERLINSTANNSYGKAQRTMARRIIEELRRSQ
jgi:hypothetical protein